MADNLGYDAGTGANVATDERTIAATTVHIQRVGEIGSANLASGQTTISSTAANIAAARDTRKRIVIVNQQTVSVWVGPATVTTSNGVRLDPGASLVLYTTVAVQGITSAAYSASGDAKVQYIEEYD